MHKTRPRIPGIYFMTQNYSQRNCLLNVDFIVCMRKKYNNKKINKENNNEKKKTQKETEMENYKRKGQS